MHILKLDPQFPFWSFQWWPQKYPLPSNFKFVKNILSKCLNQKYSWSNNFSMHFWIVSYFVEKESEANPCLISLKFIHQLDSQMLSTDSQTQISAHSSLLDPLLPSHSFKAGNPGNLRANPSEPSATFSARMEYNTELEPFFDNPQNLLHVGNYLCQPNT